MLAFAEAREDVERYGSLEVPLRLRNAPTPLMKQLGYGSGYRYAHDEPEAFAAGERYLPDAMPDRHYYRPTSRGLEQRIAETLRTTAQAGKTRRHMIDPKLLRSEPEVVARNLARRGYAFDVTAFQQLEQQRRQWQIETDRLRAALQRARQDRGPGACPQGETSQHWCAEGDALTVELVLTPSS